MSAPLRCRPGDLAIVVASSCGELGKVVRCVRLLWPEENLWRAQDGPIWLLDRALRRVMVDESIKATLDFPDNALRPLRDSDGTDEMLRIAGLPQPVETPAPVEPEHAA